MAECSAPPPVREVLYIDLWPDAPGPGIWQPRFATVPRLIAEAGATATVSDLAHLDPAALSAHPPHALILSGSRYNLVPHPAEDPVDGVALAHFVALTRLLERIPLVPVLGICFGFQYLSLAGGGELARLPVPRKDPAWPVTREAEDPLFAGITGDPAVVENHLWRVARTAPGWEVIARSSDGIEAARHMHLPRHGVQFHPEYHQREGATDHGRRILENWLGWALKSHHG